MMPQIVSARVYVAPDDAGCQIRHAHSHVENEAWSEHLVSRGETEKHAPDDLDDVSVQASPAGPILPEAGQGIWSPGCARPKTQSAEASPA